LSNSLPAGWARARIADLADAVQYGSSAKSSEQNDDGQVPVLGMSNIFEGRLRFTKLKYLPRGHDKFPGLLLAPGDVLFNRTNSPELVGKTAVYMDGHPTPCSFASYLIRVRLRDYEPALLAAYINSSHGRAWVRSCVTQQVGQANVSGGKLKEFEVPVPPLNEQRRIVAKLEALQARSRRAREALEAVPPLLEKLRQSILAAAFRGDLTKDWREKHPDVEPASELLKRIRIERRKKWEEAELAKMKAKGKTPADDRWKAKYVEPKAVDATGLPELPRGWAWGIASELSIDIVDCPHTTPTYGSGPCFAIDTTCILPGMVVTARLRRVELETYALRTARLVPCEGDVVFAREGTVGTAVSLPDSPKVCLGQRVMLLRPSSFIASRWLERSLMSPPVWAQYRQKLVGSTVPHLNVSDVVRLAIPVPPRVEQQLILRLLLSWDRFLDSVSSNVQQAQMTSQQLEAVVLAKAFRGKLVPQDPNDEPAEVMLARLYGSNGAQENETDDRKQDRHAGAEGSMRNSGGIRMAK
jgi:type I restriction enzyme S subunit